MEMYGKFKALFLSNITEETITRFATNNPQYNLNKLHRKHTLLPKLKLILYEFFQSDYERRGEGLLKRKKYADFQKRIYANVLDLNGQGGFLSEHFILPTTTTTIVRRRSGHYYSRWAFCQIGVI